MGALTAACRAQRACHSSSLLITRVVGEVTPLALPFSMVENGAPAARAATVQRMMTEESRRREARATAYGSRKLVAPTPD